MVDCFQKKTNKIITGPNAPTASNLKAFLQKHPSYEVLRGKADQTQQDAVNLAASMFIPDLTTLPIKSRVPWFLDLFSPLWFLVSRKGVGHFWSLTCLWKALAVKSIWNCFWLHISVNMRIYGLIKKLFFEISSNQVSYTLTDLHHGNNDSKTSKSHRLVSLNDMCFNYFINTIFRTC